MKSRKLSSIAGFTLLEVLVAAALLAVLSATAAVASMAFLRNAQQNKLRMTRDQLLINLRQTVLHKKAIRLSTQKPINIAFKNCVCGIGTCKNLEQPYLSFSLYDTSDTLISPRYYDVEGARCDDPANVRCVIRVSTSFFAQCRPDFTSPDQNPPPTCDGTPAEFVSIFYMVDQNPISVSTTSVQLKVISGPVYIQQVDIDPGACL